MDSSLKLDLGVQVPVATQENYFHRYHGMDYSDGYHWTRDDARNSSAVLNYLQEENAYSRSVLKPLAPLVDRIFKEFDLSKIKRDYYPFVQGEFTYFSSSESGKPLYYRKKEDRVEMIKDFNNHKNLHRVENFCPSRDNKLLAYTIDSTGNEVFDLYLKDMETGEESVLVEGVCGEFIWSANSQYLFYLLQDESMRPYRLIQYNLQDKTEQTLYTEEDEEFYLYLTESTSKSFLFLNVHKLTSSEVYYFNLTNPSSKLTLVTNRSPGRIYTVEHQTTNFIILSNLHNGKRYTNNLLLMAPIANPTNWSQVMHYNPDEHITQVFSMEKYIVMSVRVNSVIQVKILNHHTPAFNESLFIATIPGQLLNYTSDNVPIVYSSPTTSRSLYNFNLNSHHLNLIQQDEVANYDPLRFSSKKLVTPNGVPITITFKKGLLNGKNPVVLEGFGSYGLPLEPGFRPEILPLLNRGFIYALAHVRGGSELGVSWYEAGKLLQKHNSFDDYAECARHLRHMNLTSYIVAKGIAAGGLLVTAAINQNPDLFQTAVLQVPFVDLLNTMMDPTLPLTTTEYEEWGNPNNLTYFDYIRNYSPYDNIPTLASNFPKMLIHSGLNNIRVQYWGNQSFNQTNKIEPAKYVAKLRHLHPNSTILHTIDLTDGQLLTSDITSVMRLYAQDYAFIITNYVDNLNQSQE